MNSLARLFCPAALLAGACCVLNPAVQGQTVYENYTFLTVAGPSEGGGGWFDGTNTAARFNISLGIGSDASGNTYVADSGNHTIRKIAPNGMVTTLAGLAGATGSTDGRGSVARFNNPADVAVDGAGNIFVADRGNHTIRKITPAAEVSTLAGLAGVPGSANGTGSGARFNNPESLTLGPSGDLFVADTGNHTIRKLTQAGVVTLVAGAAGVSGTANGTGSLARFNTPEGITVDSHTNLFVADTVNDTIRKITAAGVVTTFAGSAGISGSANGTGTAARFYYPCAVAVATNGSVYVADTYNHTIRKVTSTGVVTTPAGSAGTLGSVDGNGSNARFNYPFGIALAPNGDVLLADTYNSTVRRMDAGTNVTTVAGLAAGIGSADENGLDARFNYPSGVAVDATGKLFVADLANYTIRTIMPNGDVATLAGTVLTSGTNDGTGSAARFNEAIGVAVDNGGTAYVADTYNHTIRQITPGGVVTTLAGAPTLTGTNNGTGSAARFNNPFGVAVDVNTNIYVADTYNHAIRKIAPGGVVTTLAGQIGTSGTNDGQGVSAHFYYPEGVGVDTNGNVYVADDYNHSIRMITPGGLVTTLAGSTNGVAGSTDGTGTAAQFKNPFAVAVDNSGNVFVTDDYNYTIRKITPAGVVTTLAGTPGTAGGANGTGPDAGFRYPEGIAVDTNGIVYVADSSNHSIRKGYPALPDRPVVDLPNGGVGIQRQLDVTNVTTTSWLWTIVRAPTASSAQLSSTTARNPTFTPDIAEVYVFRFKGWNDEGLVALGTVTITADIKAPTLAITSPSSGQRWSNAVFTVTGTAADNVAVASVNCQVNGGSWVTATGTNNWSAPVNLTAGTNVVSAYATDTTGNLSPTSSVSFVYIAVAPLLIQTNGLGSLSPNYGGKLLEIGKLFTITATNAAGFAFANWVMATNSNWGAGTVVTNRALTFVMQSNLTLQANFKDLVKPTLTFTYPTSGQRVTNTGAPLSVAGRATDNYRLTNIFYTLNAGAWASATTTNGWTNWTAAVTPPAGTNVVKAYSVDTAGNSSTTNSLTFTYVITGNFTPTTLDIARVGASQIAIGVNGISGQTIILQTSSNLLSWQPLVTNILPASRWVYTNNPSPGTSQQLFRARNGP